MNLDSYFGIHAKALNLRDQRAAQIAMNITNANTPHYKAKDLDFKAALTGEMGLAQPLERTAAGHMNGGADYSVNLKDRKINHPVGADGNTVDKDAETIAFSRNSLDYQTSLNFLGGKIKSMMLAIRGE